jgi:hypothetical protein
LMGVFGPVIETLVLPMLDPGHDLPLDSGVRVAVGCAQAVLQKSIWLENDARGPYLPE